MRARSQSSQHSQSRLTGTLQTIRRGIARLCAYIATRVRGTQTPATATKVGCSSFRLRGGRWEVRATLTLLRRANSSTARGAYTSVTAARGTSGEPHLRVVLDDAWERRNREILGR